jgi:hypothetical protein
MDLKLRIGIEWILSILRVKNIDYQITGGLAANLYGSKREIYDIDLEVSDSDVYRLSKICREYIIYGPNRYVDEHFDLLLMTLKYRDQLIDVCGIDNMSIGGERQNIDLSSAVDIGDYRVVSLGDLVSYKKLLCRDVDLIDIRNICN